MKSFECPKSIRNYIKKIAWNIRRLVDKSFVPANQRVPALHSLWDLEKIVLR